MGEVTEFDQAFIQDPEHRPTISISEAEGIPLIDLSPVVLNSSDPSSSDEAVAEVVRQIGSACEQWGFFQVINHGVPLQLREKIFRTSKEFFAQPLEEKRKVRRSEESVCGYFDTELTKNVRDWKEVFDFIAEDPTIVPASPDPDEKDVIHWHNQWPQYPPHFRLIY